VALVLLGSCQHLPPGPPAPCSGVSQLGGGRSIGGQQGWLERLAACVAASHAAPAAHEQCLPLCLIHRCCCYCCLIRCYCCSCHRYCCWCHRHRYCCWSLLLSAFLSVAAGVQSRQSPGSIRSSKALAGSRAGTSPPRSEGGFQRNRLTFLLLFDASTCLPVLLGLVGPFCRAFSCCACS
jgi:hypothetical protein